MVALRFFLRVLLPFDIHAGWRAIEEYLSSPTNCACASVHPAATPAASKTEYHAPRVKFAEDADGRSSSSDSTSTGGSCDARGRRSLGRQQSTDTIDDRPQRTPCKPPRRTRSLLVRQEAKNYPTKGEPETLFRDTSQSFRGEASQQYPDLLALKAELYDKEIHNYKRIIDDLTEQLADAQGILTATEVQVEQVLQRNAKLEKEAKRLTYDNTQLYDQFEQLREDLITLHEWIYSVQAPLTQLGIYPTALNEKLNVRMKVPRAFPTLSPHVSSRLATSDEYFTPPSTPPPPKGPALKPEKRLRPSVRTDIDWDDESLGMGARPFALSGSGPVACSSPAPSRPSSPSPLACSSPKRQPSHLRLPSPSI